MTAHHPYRDLPDYQFWPRAVSWAAPGGLDPVAATKFRVTPDDRVATLGSCFAQHLSRHLSRSGLTYFVAEQAAGHLSATEARRRNYGVFSARYGNVYTVAQAVQLFRRAYGDFVPAEPAWIRDSVCVDPFRPQIEPDGFADTEALQADRQQHFAATRAVFEESDVLVFTLGLTEAWRSRDDGAVFPTAPGVAGGSYDPEAYEFVNFGIDDVRARSPRALRPRPVGQPDAANPAHRVPRPARRDLRAPPCARVDDLQQIGAPGGRRGSNPRLDFVDYFPSYELIAPASSPRNYYGDDLREVDDLGVAHVMRCFTRHYIDGDAWDNPMTSSPSDLPVEVPDGDDAVVCDEEAVAAAIIASLPARQIATPVPSATHAD